MASRQVTDATVDVAVVCALELEAGPLAERLDGCRKTTAHRFKVRQGMLGRCRVAVIEAGVRRTQLAGACDAALAVHRPAWVVAAGFAFGLSDQLRSGELIVASDVISESGDRLQSSPVGQNVFGRGGEVRSGPIVSLSGWPRTSTRKRKLEEQTGAIAADLQSHTVGRCCVARDIRFLAVRILADARSQDTPPELLAVYNPSRSFRVGATVGAWLDGSGRAPRIRKHRGEAKGHAVRLAEFLTEVLPRLEGLEFDDDVRGLVEFAHQFDGDFSPGPGGLDQFAFDAAAGDGSPLSVIEPGDEPGSGMLQPRSPDPGRDGVIGASQDREDAVERPGRHGSAVQFELERP